MPEELPPRRTDAADVPLPAEGLSKTQRQEVLRLMSGIMNK